MHNAVLTPPDTKVPVIIYDGGAEENDILQENFLRPTGHVDKTFRGPLDITR